MKSKCSRPFIINEVMPHEAMILEDPDTKRTWTMNDSKIKHYFGWWCWEAHHCCPLAGSLSPTRASSLKDAKEALLGGNLVFLNFVLICVIWILCLMFLNYISELYFFVFIGKLCFWMYVSICWLSIVLNMSLFNVKLCFKYSSVCTCCLFLLICL